MAFNLFKKIINSTEQDELKKEIEELKTQLGSCNEKLHEKQEHINKTNAYWKKKVHSIVSKKAN